jgi:signal transduction histidine kinase
VIVFGGIKYMLKLIYDQEEDYIIESKKRCVELGMDPNKIWTTKDSMTEFELARKREDYKEILEVARFFSEKIVKSLEGTPLLIGISDEKGYLLDTLGDETIKSIMNQLGIEPGVCFKNEDIGTNVVRLTLEQNHPVQLLGTNHFHTFLYNNACYGVPFHDKEVNDLLGSVCIMTSIDMHSPFFLMTLTTVVDAIERELLIRKQNRKINEQQRLLYESEKKQRKLLEHDLIMKDEFISLITHEFKTPINVIYSAIQLIELAYIEKVPEQVRNLVSSIKRNTFRQLRLVNNLLDITRLNSKQFKLNLRNVDIVLLTKLIIESIKIYANQKKINIYFRSNINNKNIVVDDEKYERIILNLLSNAIKFTNEGGSITVMVKENKENKTVAIAVSDTGIGIPKEKQGIIFERFGQVDTNLSRQAEGSGIGLALVRKLIDILEGTIQVESELDIGSTFTITLPIRKCITQNEDKDCLGTDNRLINSVDVEFSDIYF